MMMHQSATAFTPTSPPPVVHHDDVYDHAAETSHEPPSDAHAPAGVAPHQRDPAVVAAAVGHWVDPPDANHQVAATADRTPIANTNKPAMTPEQAASFVNGALHHPPGKEDPLQSGATALWAALLDVAPAQRAAVIAMLKPELADMGQRIASGHSTVVGDALTAFTQSAELVDPASAKAIASSVATAMDGSRSNPGQLRTQDVIGNLVRADIANGEGARFGVSLAQAFTDEHKTDLASSVASNVVSGVKTLQADYNGAVGVRDGKLQQLYADAGPGMAALTDKQQQAVLANFKAETHCEDAFTNTDSAGRTLAQAVTDLQGLPQHTGDVQSVTRTAVASIADNAGAQRYFADQLEAQVKGDPNNVQQFFGMLGEVDKDAKVAGDVANLVVKSTGMAAISALEKGESKQAAALLDGLKASRGLLGVSDTDLASLTKAFGSGNSQQIETAFEHTSNDFGGEVGAKALEGLGLALGAYSLVDEVGSATSVSDRMHQLVEATDTGTGAAMFALDLLGKEAPQILQDVHGAAGALGTVFDVLTVATDVRDLDLKKGSSQLQLGSDALSAIAGVMFAAGAAAEGLPLAGQVVGTLCILGSLALGGMSEDQKSQEAIDQRLHWLEGSGVNLDCGVANVLSHSDASAIKAWNDAGVAPATLQSLIVKYESVPMVSDGRQVPALTQMARECNMSESEVLSMIDHVAIDRATFERMLNAIPDLPPGNGAYSSAREKWLAALKPPAMDEGAYPTGEGPWDMKQTLYGYVLDNTQDEPACRPTI